MSKNENIYIFGKTFGERLRLAREQAGISQTELANILGYKTSGSISNIESGRSKVDSEVLFGLSKCLSVDLHWLITGETFDPKKRIVSRIKETYSGLLKEFHEAQETIQRLEGKKQSGQPLTPEEENELAICRNGERTSIRKMENSLRAASRELEDTLHQ